MPFLTTTGGLNFSYPTDGTTNWGSTLKTSFNTISGHNHTGAPNGVQLGTNSLQNNAVVGTKFRLTNDSFLRGRNAADSADVNILKVTSGDALQFGNGTSNATISAANITLSGSGTISSSGPFVFPAGTAGAPSLTFASDLNTGFYQIAADTIGAATNGVERVRVDTAAVTSALPVVHPAGTAGAPSLTFASDLNTGFYQIAADTIGVSTAGSERVRIDSAGLVGIGGTPSYKLHVQTDGNDIFGGFSYNNTDGNVFRMWRARGTAASPSGVQAADTLASLRGFGYTSAGAFSTSANAAIDFSAGETFSGTAQGSYITLRTTANGTTTASERIRITGAGDVGIGTALPTNTANVTTLHVTGNTASRLLLERTSATASIRGIYNDSGGLGFYDYTAAANRMYIDSSGNVGIGTTTPNFSGFGSTNLTVAGASTLQGTLELVGNRVDGDLGTAGHINFFANAQSAGNKIIGTIRVSTDGATANNRGGRFSFEVKQNNGAIITAQTILQSGDVGIGTTSTGGYRVAIVGSAASSKTLYLHTDASSSYVYSPDPMSIGSTGANAVNIVANNTVRATFPSAGGFTCLGIYNTLVGTTNRDVFVDDAGKVGYTTSTRASKTEIQELTDISWIYQLNPVSFKFRKRDENGEYTEETDGDIQYGMIAEDVQPIRPDICFYDEVDGRQELRGIQYSKLTVVLLKAIQELRAELTALKAQVTPH